jgi:hypothetical protein
MVNGKSAGENPFFSSNIDNPDKNDIIQIIPTFVEARRVQPFAARV